MSGAPQISVARPDTEQRDPRQHAVVGDCPGAGAAQASVAGRVVARQLRGNTVSEEASLAAAARRSTSLAERVYTYEYRRPRFNIYIVYHI